MRKYRLLRDCPHGKAGSVWTERDTGEYTYIWLREGEGYAPIAFPKSTFSDWFEEIKEMPKFTKEQRMNIKIQMNVATLNARHVTEWVRHISDWLDENTLS